MFPASASARPPARDRHAEAGRRRRVEDACLPLARAGVQGPSPVPGSLHPSSGPGLWIRAEQSSGTDHEAGQHGDRGRVPPTLGVRARGAWGGDDGSVPTQVVERLGMAKCLTQANDTADKRGCRHVADANC